MSESPTKKSRRMRSVTHVLAIDVETSGQNLVANFMPEFGACLWKIGDTEPADSFYRAIKKPEGTEWDAITKKEFWDNPDKGENGLSPFDMMQIRLKDTTVCDRAQAMCDFVAWTLDVEEKLGEDESVVIVFDTAGFDAAWISYNLAVTSDKHQCGSVNYLFGKYRPTRDIDSVKFGIGKRLQLWGSEKVFLDALGLDSFPEWVTQHKHNHHPLKDATHIAAQAAFVASKMD